jgi:hypothetical protein
MPPTARSRLLTLAFLAMIACGGESSLTQQEALPLWAKATCNAVRRCDPGMLAAIGVTPETCEQRLTSDLTASGDPRCDGGEQFDGDAARACIRQIETAPCMKDGQPPEPCSRVCKSRADAGSD